MALDVEKGVFVANTSTGDQTVSLSNGSLTPKAVVLWGSFDTSATVVDGDGIFSFGIGTRDGGSTQQGYVAMFYDDNAGTSAAVHDLDSDAVYKILTSDAVDATATDAQATLVSFGAGQFVINWSNAPSIALRIHYWVIGGSDVTAARVTKPTATTAAATQDVTVNAGFGQPDLVLFASHGFNNLYAQDDARFMFGAANKGGSQSCCHVDFEDASNNMSLAAWYSASRCLLFYTGSIAKDAEGSISASGSWPTDGYQITWNDQAGFAFHFLSLALKGSFLSEIGSAAMLTSGSTQDLDLGSGTPKGALLMAQMVNLTDNTIDSTATDLGGFFFGGTDGTNEGGAGFVDNDGAGTSAASRYSTETKAIQRYVQGGTAAATLDAEADASVSTTNIRLTYNDLAAVAADFVWVVVGEAAAGGTTTPQELSATATSSGLLIKQVNKLTSATVTSTATMQRQTSKNVSATSTTTASIRKQVNKALSATATSTASLAAVKVILKALTATATSTASMARSVLKNLSATSTTSSSIQKQTNKTLSATSTSTASLQALKVIVKALTATATASASLSKRVNKSLSATVTSTPSMVKTVLKNLSATSTLTATLQALRVVLKAMTATVTTSASIARQVQFHLSATVTATATLTKVVQKRVSAGVATTASMLTDIFLAGAEPIVRFFKGTLGGGTGRGTPSGGTGPGSPGGSFFDDAPPGDH